jgi:hypothetical protein
MSATWSGTTQGQTVSRNALSNAVSIGLFRVKNAFSADVQQINKAEADVDVYIDTNHPSYAAKASNQLVYKRDLKPDWEYSALLYYFEEIKFNYYGWETSIDACSLWNVEGLPTNVYWNGTLGIGTRLYTDRTVDGSYFILPPYYPYYVIINSGQPTVVTFDASSVTYVGDGSSFEYLTTITSTSVCTSSIPTYINNTSTDVPITGVSVNFIPLTYVSGDNFPVNSFQQGNFATLENGLCTVIIDFGSHTPFQSIVFTDSDGFPTYYYLGDGLAGQFIIANAAVNTNGNLNIEVFPSV